MTPNHACYDLGSAPASWDFVTWLLIAEMERRKAGADGPLKVAFKPGPKDGFRDDGLPLTTAQRQGMLENVMRPALALVGAVETDEALGGAQYGYLANHLVRAAWEGVEPPMLIKGEGTPNGPVVITLREADYWEERNSDLEAWQTLARDLMDDGEEVIFIRDTAKADEAFVEFGSDPEAARDLHKRAALMARAKVNLMACNGPHTLAVFSRVPYRIFKPLAPRCPATTAAWWRDAIGVPVGSQFPWCVDGKQEIIWAPDHVDVLRYAWDDLPVRKKIEEAA